MSNADQEDLKMLNVLREAVAEALERKRRLGQYAVVWRNGEPAFIDYPPPTTREPEKPAAPAQ
ncbi:MAG: hypothetical protein WAV07_01790 [Candidatus Contendobacter sp.]